METQIEIKEVNKPCTNCNRCSDFDEDCNDVTDKLHCFLHGTWNKGEKLPQGYCPFIHTKN